MDGNSLENAIITLGNNTNAPNIYSFFQLEPGVYNYSVSLNGYNSVQGDVEVTDQNVTVVVTMISEAVSLRSIPYTSVRMFPNPASSTVSLIVDSEIEEIAITDISGRIVHKQQVGANSARIDISEFPAGLYLVHLATQNEMIIKKMLVEK